MNRKLKRSTLAAIEDWWNGNQGGGRAPTMEEQVDRVVNSQTFFGVYQRELITLNPPPIMPGDYLFPRSFCPPTISYANAVKQIYRNKLKVVVDITSAYVAGDNPIVALTPAKVGRICQFKSLGDLLYYANIAIPDPNETYLYVDVNGTATNTEDDAYADILFMTGASNGYAVGMCEKIETGVTAQDVISEITSQDILRKLGASRKSQSVVTEVNFNIDSNGYLEIIPTFTTIRYIGWEL